MPKKVPNTGDEYCLHEVYVVNDTLVFDQDDGPWVKDNIQPTLHWGKYAKTKPSDKLVPMLRYPVEGTADEFTLRSVARAFAIERLGWDEDCEVIHLPTPQCTNKDLVRGQPTYTNQHGKGNPFDFRKKYLVKGAYARGGRKTTSPYAGVFMTEKKMKAGTKIPAMFMYVAERHHPYNKTANGGAKLVKRENFDTELDAAHCAEYMGRADTGYFPKWWKGGLTD